MYTNRFIIMLYLFTTHALKNKKKGLICHIENYIINIILIKRRKSPHKIYKGRKIRPALFCLKETKKKSEREEKTKKTALQTYTRRLSLNLVNTSAPFLRNSVKSIFAITHSL